MLITEKKIRSIIRKILLQEAPFDPTDVTKSFDLEKAIDLARKLVAKDSVKKNEKDKEESIKISKALTAIRDGVPGEPSQRFQMALAQLLNFEGPGKNEPEYIELLEMIRSYLGSNEEGKKGDGQADKITRPDGNIKEIQQKLNSLNFKDYKGRALVVDGKWGKSTRSAVSSMLKMINEEPDGMRIGLFDKLNLNLIPNDALFDKLETGARGPGSWKKLSIKLVEGKPFYDGGGKYQAVLAILDRFEEGNVQPEKAPSTKTDGRTYRYISQRNEGNNREDFVRVGESKPGVIVSMDHFVNGKYKPIKLSKAELSSLHADLVKQGYQPTDSYPKENTML